MHQELSDIAVAAFVMASNAVPPLEYVGTKPSQPLEHRLCGTCKSSRRTLQHARVAVRRARRNCSPLRIMRCTTTASLRASATLALPISAR